MSTTASSYARSGSAAASTPGSSHADLSSRAGSYKAAAKLCAKAEGLVDELERLYEFGVDIDLMESNEAIQDNLLTTRFLFRKSVNLE